MPGPAFALRARRLAPSQHQRGKELLLRMGLHCHRSIDRQLGAGSLASNTAMLRWRQTKTTTAHSSGMALSNGRRLDHSINLDSAAGIYSRTAEGGHLGPGFRQYFYDSGLIPVTVMQLGRSSDMCSRDD